MTKSLTFSVRVPVVMSLVVPVILVERIVKVTINPRKLRNMTEIEWSLGNISWNILVVLSKRINLLIEIAVNNLVTPVIVRLTTVHKVLWHVRVIKVEGHYLSII